MATVGIKELICRNFCLLGLGQWSVGLCWYRTCCRVAGTVMCYGQTGAGKTFTMTGSTESYQNRGIIPRAITQLFRQLDERSDCATVVRFHTLLSFSHWFTTTTITVAGNSPPHLMDTRTLTWPMRTDCFRFRLTATTGSFIFNLLKFPQHVLGNVPEVMGTHFFCATEQVAGGFSSQSQHGQPFPDLE